MRTRDRLVRASSRAARCIGLLIMPAVHPATAADAPQVPHLQTPVLITSVRNSYPSPSPDGEHVVFQSNRSGRGEIYRMRRDGSELRRLSSLPGDSSSPKWSPDGRLVVFAANRASPANVGQLYLVALDDPTPRQLTFGPRSIVQPALTVDGKRLYAYVNDETADYEYGDVIEFSFVP